MYYITRYVKGKKRKMLQKPLYTTNNHLTYVIMYCFALDISKHMRNNTI